MIDENPYAAGDAPAGADAGAPATVALTERPTRRPASFGFGWVRSGFSDFSRGPFAYVGFVVLLSGAMMMISLVANLAAFVDPIAGALVNSVTSLGLNLALFVLAAGLLLAVHHARATGQVRFDTFLAGFSHPRLGALLGLGGLYMAGTFAILVVMVAAFLAFVGPTAALGFFELGGASEMPARLRDEDVIIALVSGLGAFAAVAFAIVGMLFFFAVHLVTFTETNVFEAMKLSFLGCLTNIVPLFVWSAVASLLGLIGLLPCGLGLLVVLPAMWASSYQAFLDIYASERAADTLSGGSPGAPTI